MQLRVETDELGSELEQLTKAKVSQTEWIFSFYLLVYITSKHGQRQALNKARLCLRLTLIRCTWL